MDRLITIYLISFTFDHPVYVQFQDLWQKLVIKSSRNEKKKEEAIEEVEEIEEYKEKTSGAKRSE